MGAKKIEERVSLKPVGWLTIFSMMGFFFIAAGIFVLVFLIVGMVESGLEQDLGSAVGVSVCLFGFSGLLFLIGWLSMKASQKDMNDWIDFATASTITTAKTIKRGRKKHIDDDGDTHYTYWITVQFQLIEVKTNSKDIVLRVNVSKKRHDAFVAGQYFKVRYPNSNPSVALMEWETSRIERTPNFVAIMLQWVLANIIGGVAGFYISNVLGIDDLLLSGAIAGLIIAEAQWIVLFRYFPVPNWKWVIACMVGWAVFVRLNTIAYGFIGGTILGMIQWFVLRKKVTNAEWWVAFTAFGMTVGQIAFNLMIPRSTGTAAVATFYLVYGAITGVGIYLIANQSFRQNVPDSTLKYVQEPLISQEKSQAPENLSEEFAEGIKLVVNGKIVSDAPDENNIRQTLESLIEKEEGFAILSRTETTYIQAAYGGGENFIMEYQDGSTTEHYDCISPDLNPRKVVKAFIMFLNSDEQLTIEFSWELMGV